MSTTDSPATPHDDAPGFLPELAERLPLIRDLGPMQFDHPAMRAWDAPHGEPETWDLQIADRELPGPHGPVPVRIYAPSDDARDGAADDPTALRPCLVWLHGGAFIGGDLDMPEAHEVTRGIAGRAGAVVVSVFYRLCDAPGAMGGAPATTNPRGETGVHAPIPLDDAHAALEWVRQNAAELGADAARIAVGGTSAGGALAAALSQRLADEGAPAWRALLMYPVVHAELPEPTAEEAAALDATPEILRFRPQATRMMNENYLGGPVGTAGPYEFAALADPAAMAALPPTYIEADEFDDLRRSGRAYAEQLRDAGVDVTFEIRRGVPHGHLNRVGLSAAAQSLDRMAALLGE